MNKDTLTTAAGAVAGVSVGSQIDVSKLVHLDVGELAKAGLAIALAIWGWATNKPGKN